MASQFQKPEVLARLFGVTTRRVQQLTQDGILVSEKVQGSAGRQYDLVPNIKSYIAYLQERLKAKGGGSAANAEAKLAAEVRLKTARASVAELELKELRGQVFRADDIERMTNELVYSARAMMLSIPPRCSVDLAETNDPNEVRNYLQGVVNAMLTELSQHEYSADRYLELIHKREGLAGGDEDEDEEIDDMEAVDAGADADE